MCHSVQYNHFYYYFTDINTAAASFSIACLPGLPGHSPCCICTCAWFCIQPCMGVCVMLLLLRCKLGKAAASINIISMCKQTNIPDSLSSQLFNQHWTKQKQGLWSQSQLACTQSIMSWWVAQGSHCCPEPANCLACDRESEYFKYILRWWTLPCKITPLAYKSSSHRTNY